jgi:hypothetical protein
MLTWTTGRRVFPPAQAQLPAWIGGFGALPFAIPEGEGRARVFFSGRDERNRSRIGACTLDLEQLTIDEITKTPLVDVGPAGAFDESGCSMSCVIRDGGRWLLYYTGWMLGRTVPFYLAVGLAISTDGGRTFTKYSPAPILDRHPVDPFLTASPSVLVEDGVWRMWYVSAVEWEQRDGGLRHRYLIKAAESRDGITWERDGRIAIPFESADEYAMGRPHVVKNGDGYRMWFCVRGDRYRIVCAESRDGRSWHRVSVNAPPPHGWDAEMQAYPMEFSDGPRVLLLYNGNGYGATGFGCATGEELR